MCAEAVIAEAEELTLEHSAVARAGIPPLRSFQQTIVTFYIYPQLLRLMASPSLSLLSVCERKRIKKKKSKKEKKG